MRKTWSPTATSVGKGRNRSLYKLLKSKSHHPLGARRAAEFEYIRDGTKALIAAFDVATGKVRGTISDSRTEADFVAFLDTLLASAPPTAPWDVVCDNLNTHMSEGVVRLVAQLCGINEELDEKGKSGIFGRWQHARRS
jgi:hypothetical protein